MNFLDRIEWRNPFAKRQPPKSAGVQLPAFLPILVEMNTIWDDITEADIERAHRHLMAPQPGDIKLGVLHSPEVRRTWAAADLMVLRCREAQLFAQGQAKSDEENQYYLERAKRFDVLDDCFKQLFFAQARDDIGGDAWKYGIAVGVRSGWMFVKGKRPEMPGFVVELSGGPVPEGERP